MNEADRVFEFAERRIDAPAPGVELPQRRKRELCGVQVGHQHLRFAVFPLQTYNSRRKRIEISAFRAKKVKWYAVWEPVIVLRDRSRNVLSSGTAPWIRAWCALSVRSHPYKFRFRGQKVR